MPITDAQKRAIARIQLTAGGKLRWGTGFLVEGDKLLLTAFHVVGDHETKAPFQGPYYVDFLDPASNQRFNTRANLVDNEYNAEEDWALLQCTGIPPNAAPFQLAPLRPGYAIEWATYGFPKEAPDLGKVYEGRVQSIGTIVQLSTGRDGGDGKLLEGLSGSPCLVNGRVVGLILNLNEWEDDARHPQDDALFVLPVKSLRSKTIVLPKPDPPAFLAEVAYRLRGAEDLLEGAATELQIPTPTNYSPDDLRKTVAEAMLRGGIEATLAGLVRLGDGVDEKKGRQILNFAAALWIDDAAAARIERAFSTQARKTAVCLNAAESITGERYIHRAGYARARHPGWLTRLWSVSDAHQEQRQRGIREEVREILARRLECSPDDLEASLEEAAKGELPIIITLPPPPLAPTDLTALREEFPEVCFVVLAGDESADALRATYGGELVEPLILPGQERAVSQAQKRAQKQLSDVHKRLREYEDKA